jgi:hypothetical protein
MKSQEYPIQHFKLMNSISSELAKLPAQIQEHNYTYVSFGSWNCLIQYKGTTLRVIFDGRDNFLIIEKKINEIWQEVFLKSIDINNNENVVSLIFEGITNI